MLAVLSNMNTVLSRCRRTPRRIIKMGWPEHLRKPHPVLVLRQPAGTVLLAGISD
jgi:hypothetical protein